MSKAKSKLTIHWQLDDKSWRTIRTNFKALGNKSIKRTLEYLEIDTLYSSIEISVLLSNDVKLQELNKLYRGKNKPTNVLSFPTNTPLTKGEDVYLGDIAISFNTLYNEAQEQNKTFQDHFAHMVVHSTLHLLGYDHEKKAEAAIMESLEKKILSSLNIKNPYE
jgi:probable rRNA maturation factor